MVLKLYRAPAAGSDERLRFENSGDAAGELQVLLQPREGGTGAGLSGPSGTGGHDPPAGRLPAELPVLRHGVRFFQGGAGAAAGVPARKKVSFCKNVIDRCGWF